MYSKTSKEKNTEENKRHLHPRPTSARKWPPALGQKAGTKQLQQLGVIQRVGHSPSDLRGTHIFHCSGFIFILICAVRKWNRKFNKTHNFKNITQEKLKYKK